MEDFVKAALPGGGPGNSQSQDSGVRIREEQGLQLSVAIFPPHEVHLPLIKKKKKSFIPKMLY